MSLDRMFAAVHDLREVAAVGAAFGDPQEVEGKVLIPVAAVRRAFGMGFGIAAEERELPAESEGGGGGGAARSHPVAVIEVTPEETVVRPILDETRVAVAGVALIGWTVFWVTATVRSVFGRRRKRGS